MSQLRLRLGEARFWGVSGGRLQPCGLRRWAAVTLRSRASTSHNCARGGREERKENYYFILFPQTNFHLLNHMSCVDSSSNVPPSALGGGPPKFACRPTAARPPWGSAAVLVKAVSHSELRTVMKSPPPPNI